MDLVFLPAESEPDPNPNINASPNDNLKLLRRDYHTISLPATYGRQHTSPPPGTVVGIVLGSVAGFILFLYLLYITLSAGRGQISWGSSSVSEEVVVRRRAPGPRRPPSRRSPDIVEVEVEEERERERYRTGTARRQRSGGWRRGEQSIVVDESVEGTDIIEVVEEEEEERPGRRRTGSYRTVDPMAYGGSD